MLVTVFPQIMAEGDCFFFFSRKKGGDYLKEGGYLREAIILNNYFLLRGDDYSREAVMLNIFF